MCLFLGLIWSSTKILKRRLLGMVQKWNINVLLCDETGGETLPAFLWKRENKQCLCTSRIREIMYSINSCHKLLSISVS
jgi:hypothetical protein